jgi:hypothetical protein
MVLAPVSITSAAVPSIRHSEFPHPERRVLNKWFRFQFRMGFGSVAVCGERATLEAAKATCRARRQPRAGAGISRRRLLSQANPRRAKIANIAV